MRHGLAVCGVPPASLRPAASDAGALAWEPRPCIPDGDHQLYGQIEPLFEKAEVTPVEIAEELSRNEDTDVALRGVVELLEEKKKKKKKRT